MRTPNHPTQGGPDVHHLHRRHPPRRRARPHRPAGNPQPQREQQQRRRAAQSARLDVEPAGDTAAEDFLGRVLLAQALLDVATDDEHGRLPSTEANWTTCGRRPGYLADRLADLHTVATWANG